MNVQRWKKIINVAVAANKFEKGGISRRNKRSIRETEVVNSRPFDMGQLARERRERRERR